MTITQLQLEVGKRCKGKIDVSQAQINEAVRHTLACLVETVTEDQSPFNGYVKLCKLLEGSNKRELKGAKT